jgi:hypothetical protein
MFFAMRSEHTHRRGELPSVGGLLALLAIVSVAITATSISGGGGAGVLCVTPMLAIATMLLTRRYPGERLLQRAAAPFTRRRPRAQSSPAPRRQHLIVMARGGALIARALAVRPPPHIHPAAS